MKAHRQNIFPIIIWIFGAISGIFLQKMVSMNISKTGGIESPPTSAAQITTTPENVQNGIPEEFQGKLKLFILTGQSNMSGRGELSPISEGNLTIYVFGNDYHWKVAGEPIDNPADQVDKVSEDLEAGAGPALPFAKALMEKQPDILIGLIPCAKGDTTIFEWHRKLSEDTLYGSCLKRVRAASVMGEVAGMLFFQGESDALTPNLYPERKLQPEIWANEFSTFVDDWRRDLNKPDLPVVFAQIGKSADPERFKNWEIVQKQQLSVQISFVTMIVTEDIPSADGVHFTNEGYQMIGQRFAEAFVTIIK